MYSSFASLNKTQRETHTNNTTNLGGACFRCHKPGHWVRDCPESPVSCTRTPVSTPPPVVTHDPDFPSLYCRCGAGLCDIRVSNSVNNPGRKYYKCPSKYEKHCGYFKWCDKQRGEERPQVQIEPFPICGCGAGVATLLTEENGPNAGCRYFGCAVKKGEGACSFKQWFDNPPHSTVAENAVQGVGTCSFGLWLDNPPQSTIAGQNGVLDNVELSNGAAMQIDAAEVSACELPSQHIQLQMNAHGQPLEAHPVQTETHKLLSQGAQVQSEAHELPSEAPEVQEAREFSLQGAQVQMEAHEHHMEEAKVQLEGHELPSDGDQLREDGEADEVLDDVSEPSNSDTIIQNCVMLQQKLNDPAKVNLQACVTTVVTNLSTPLPLGMLLEYLIADLQEQKGPGRTSYPSGHFSSSAAKSLFNGSLSNHDPVSSPEENASPPSFTREEGSIMAGTILEAFDTLARRFQNKLITLLESMVPQQHEIMMKEAGLTFAALDRLQVNYTLFHHRVTQYITEAAALTRIEQSTTNKLSSQEIVEQYKNEKSRFDEIFHDYCEAKAAYLASSERLSMLQENVCCLRDMLVELETELACCEADNASLQDRLAEVTRTMSESKERLQVAMREAAEALKRSEKRDIELSAAKAAFERARAQLRN